MRTSSGRYSVVLIRTIEKSYPILSMTHQGAEDRQHNAQRRAGSKNCRGGVGAGTLLEPKVKVASQSVLYALRTRDGSCASGWGVSQARVDEVVCGIKLVEWHLC